MKGTIIDESEKLFSFITKSMANILQDLKSIVPLRKIILYLLKLLPLVGPGINFITDTIIRGDVVPSFFSRHYLDLILMFLQRFCHIYFIYKQ